MKKRSYPKPRKGAWFIKVRGSYLPCSWQGALTYIPLVAFLVTVMVESVRITKSPIEAFFLIFPNFVCAGIFMHWLASIKS